MGWEGAEEVGQKSVAGVEPEVEQSVETGARVLPWHGMSKGGGGDESSSEGDGGGGPSPRPTSVREIPVVQRVPECRGSIQADLGIGGTPTALQDQSEVAHERGSGAALRRRRERTE